MVTRKYYYKSAQEIIDQKKSYVANINMVWNAATEAAEERFTAECTMGIVKQPTTQENKTIKDCLNCGSFVNDDCNGNQGLTGCDQWHSISPVE